MARNKDLNQLQELAGQWEAKNAEAGNEFIEQIQSLVRHQVRNLSFERFASRVDTNDLTQIVLQRIAEVANRGDLSKNVTQAFFAWLKQFVKNTVTREIRNHCAQKRDWRRQSQFDETISLRFRDQRPASDLKLVVEEVIGGLSPEERELAYQLACGNSQAEIAAKMNVHPRTVRRRIVALRKPFSTFAATAGAN